MHRVVACVDGSPGSYAAFEEAAELAKRCEAELFALSVVEGLPKVPTTMDAVEHTKSKSEAYVQVVSAVINGLAGRHGVTVTHVVRIGEAADAIVAFAREVGADLVVLGSRRRSHLLRIARRSTAQKVNVRSPASLLVVKGDGLHAERFRLVELQAPTWLAHLSTEPLDRRK